MLDQLLENDVLVVWKLDRLARSTRDLLDIVEEIKKAGAGLQSLSEPWADTTSYAGKMVLTIFAGIAEFERDLIRDRTSTGRSWPPIFLRKANQLSRLPKPSMSTRQLFIVSDQRMYKPVCSYRMFSLALVGVLQSKMAPWAPMKVLSLVLVPNRSVRVAPESIFSSWAV